MINYFLSLCYHYIRQPKSQDPFPALMANRVDDFYNHISALQKKYSFISLKDVENYFYNNSDLKSASPGLLITFDDGLSDHYTSAKILAEFNISAVYFIPTSFLTDFTPANPIIIHYALAIYRIQGFLNAYKNALEEYNISFDDYRINYDRENDNPWEKIKEIKFLFKYKFNYSAGREVLLHIYRNLLLKNNPEILNIMHLTENQIREMLQMGHYIGTHTHSHISVAAASLNEEQFSYEIITPKKILEDKFKINVNAISYPFGHKKDCLSTEELIKQTDRFNLAFTVEKIKNDKSVSPYEIGRYEPMSSDSTVTLMNILDSMENNS